MFGRYSYKVNDFVILTEEDITISKKSREQPETFFDYLYKLFTFPYDIEVTRRKFEGIVVGISNFHVPEGSRYVVNVFFPEKGENIQLGVGNKDSELKKAGIFRNRKKFPSELEIKAHNLIFADSAR